MSTPHQQGRHAPGTPRLATERLLLVPLDARQLAARVACDDFTLPIAGLGRVRFGPEHPGELLDLYPLWLSFLGIDDEVLGTWTIIDRGRREAVGSVGVKGPVAGGSVELGYGVIASSRGRGIAREALAAVCEALFAGSVALDEPVSLVVAETRRGNLASQAVLRACGFRVVGERRDPHEGVVLRWECRRGTPAPGAAAP